MKLNNYNKPAVSRHDDNFTESIYSRSIQWKWYNEIPTFVEYLNKIKERQDNKRTKEMTVAKHILVTTYMTTFIKGETKYYTFKILYT